jgi:LysM repeat protein
MASKAKAKATKKASKVEEKSAKKKNDAAKSAAPGEAALKTVYKLKKPFKVNEGVLAKFSSAVPKSGATLRAIAKKAGIDVKKARGYAYFLTTEGYLTRDSA